MKLFRSILIFATAISAAYASATNGNALFSGTSALTYARHAASFGERPSGSKALVETREWILSEIKPLGGEIHTDQFTG
ncbi:MAG: hypothetical protein M3Y72_00285, partial [Acidobacteriota bacterium]|nr:hypothetical protein [Acidobacteriota bacterium]